MTKVLVLLFLAVVVVCSARVSCAQTTEFTYQGNLRDGGNAANGNYDFEFALFDMLSAGSQTGATIPKNNVSVTNGGFSVKLDFGPVFPGANRFLEIRVRLVGQPGFTTLVPRQLVNSAPYSVKSLNTDNAATATNALQLGGVAANQYVLTGDARLTDARDPLPNSANYVQNQNTAPQSSSNFDISGTGRAAIFNATSQYNIGVNRVLSIGGTNNIFAGAGAGQNNTGSNNSFFGRVAGAANTTGAFNAFFGVSAGDSNTTGNNNAFFGQSAGQANTNGGSNAFFGETSGFLTTTGFGNSFFGASAGLNNTLGNDNVIVGRDAGLTNTTGSSNTIIGSNANVGANNMTFATAIGSGAVVNASSTVVLGRAADTVQVPGGLNVTGTFTASGAGLNSLNATNISSGTLDNARLGVVPIANGGTGSPTKNFVDLTTAQTIGGNKTFSNTLSGNIINSGTHFSINGTRVFNIGEIGSGNTFSGINTGLSTSTGTNNVFFGLNTGASNNTGSENSFVGREAGVSNTSGSNNTAIGSLANVGSGALTFATAIGAGATVNASSTVVLGRAADTVRVPGNLIVTSGAGDNSVILPNSSIISGEILNEPGVASATSSLAVNLDITVKTLLSREINVPTAGFVLVIATLQVDASFSPVADFGVSDTVGIFSNQVSRIATSGTFPITVHSLFQVPSAGTFSFFLLGHEIGGDVSADDLKLTLLFVSTGYGQNTITRPEGTSVQAVPNLQTITDESTTARAESPVNSEKLNAVKEQQQQIGAQQKQIEALTLALCSLKPELEICKQK